MALVRPTQAFVSTATGYPVTLGPSDILSDEHPHVRAHPEFFERVRPTIDIEQATAGPGELRNARRS